MCEPQLAPGPLLVRPASSQPTTGAFRRRPPQPTTHARSWSGCATLRPIRGRLFAKTQELGVGSVSFRKDTPTTTQRAPPRRPAARALAPSRPPRDSVRETRPKTRGRSTRALVVVVGGGGGLVVAVGLDKDRVTGERTGERALTLARSPSREVVPERAATSPVGAKSTWAREVGSTVALTRTEDRRGRQGQGDWERPRRRAARARAAPRSSYPSVNVTRPKARGRSARALVVVGGGWAFRRSRARQGQCTWGAHRRARPHPHRSSLAPHRPGTMPHVTCGVGVDLVATVGVDCRVRCREAPIQHAK